MTKSAAEDDRSDVDGSLAENRHDQLTTAPKSTEEDAKPRIETTETGSVTRIDLRDDANARPGKPD